MKPTLKAPGSKRLKLQCDKLLSSFAFDFNWRRYTLEDSIVRGMRHYDHIEQFTSLTLA